METEKVDIAALASNLTGTIEQLTGVLNAEVDHLYTSNNKELGVYYKDKARLLADYASGVSALRSATGGGKINLPAEINARLKDGSTHLARAMERNIEALAIAQEASQRVVDALIDAVKQQRRTGAAYGKAQDGNMKMPETPDTLTQAVTLDTRL